MIKPAKSYWHEQLLHWYLDRKFKASFSAVNYILNEPIREDRSLLIIGNHSTWWDGFLVFQMNRDVLHKKYYCMMLESQLKKLWYFRRVGCFSIDPGNRSMVQSLKFASQLLKTSENMVQFYPQGRLFSLYDENFAFNKGIDFVVKNAQNTDFLLYSLFIDYSSNEKPYLNIFMKVIIDVSRYDYQSLEKLYKAFYEESKQAHIQSFKS